MGEETLPDLLRQRLADPHGERGGRSLSLRQVALRSFGRVSEATLLAILADHPAVQLTDPEINGLALALEVPVARVYLAAVNPPMRPLPVQRLRAERRYAGTPVRSVTSSTVQ